MRVPVVIAVRAEIEPAIRLYVDVFNTHDALTWISHKSTASIIGPVQSEQIETGRVRLTVPVRGKRLAGYWTEMKDGRFVLHVRHPAPIAPAPESSLKGLLIAVEAGHGGSNSGAVGHLGTKEKTINQQAALALQRELESRGAKVIQVRERDEEPGLGIRADRASEANADFFVSIHANAASTARGFLRVSGTSTYYHGMNGRLPAELVYKRLLKLGWGEFGVVGNFSYAPLRNTRVPALLVEQAFMTHPGDEARMLQPDYQRRQAIAIADGLAEYFDRMRE
jgi:N-acetylmuramoyl-L-alanine amidase